MGTTNERAAERPTKAERRERPADLYDPHFPATGRAVRQDGTAVFDPYFPQRVQPLPR